MKKRFLFLAKTSLILVYVVIFAGALVRMTGSGMGCPDWPKCFGYYIPPTEISQILWQPNHEFKKGQLIIENESLWVAKKNFRSTQTYNAENWEKYTKHDYAVFNAKHTWTEYLNRLSGALAGIACFAMALYSLKFWRSKKSLVFLSCLVVFLMGFQGWLGAIVVYSVLNPIKITIHMIMALIIVGVIICIIRIANPKILIKKYDFCFKIFLWISLFMSLIQIAIGTQLRQFIDQQISSGIGKEQLWLSSPNADFYIHRTFSIAILFVNLFLLLRNKRLNLRFQKINWVFAIIILEIISGIAMYYFNFPFGSQTIHLVAASLLFGIQFDLVLDARKKYSPTA